jgi:flagellar protein FlgJ
MAAPSIAAPKYDPALLALAANSRAPLNANGKAREAAQDFEAVFLNSMFSQMFTGIDGEGPLGGGPAVGIWRSFLTQEYAKSFAKSGGIGIADHVYRALIGQQEQRAGAAQGAGR